MWPFVDLFFPTQRKNYVARPKQHTTYGTEPKALTTQQLETDFFFLFLFFFFIYIDNEKPDKTLLN